MKDSFDMETAKIAWKWKTDFSTFLNNGYFYLTALFFKYQEMRTTAYFFNQIPTCPRGCDWLLAVTQQSESTPIHLYGIYLANLDE